MQKSNLPLETQIKQAEKRVHQHWLEDGIAEIVLGGFFLMLALPYFVEFILDQSVSALALPFITIGGVLLVRPVVHRLKGRLTYPRTGFVQHRTASPRRRTVALIVGMAIGFIAAFLIFMFIDTPENTSTGKEWLNWLPLAQAIVTAVIMGLIAFRFDVARFYSVAIVSLVAGGVIVLARLGDLLGTAVHFSVVGIALIISGIGVLRHFLQQTKPA